MKMSLRISLCFSKERRIFPRGVDVLGGVCPGVGECPDALVD